MEDKQILLVDSGNSRLKWALYRHYLVPGPALASRPLREEALEALWGALAAPARVLIANVAGKEVAEVLCAFIRSRWSLEPEFVRSQASGFGVVSGYLEPKTLGVDRWLGLVAARNRYFLPSLIADCGTALTLDVIDEAGRHKGGLICPGLKLMAETLVHQTSGIRLAEGSGFGSLGDSTSAAVHLGARQAALGVIERTFRRQQKLHPKLSLLLTGGDAEALLPELEVQAHWVPDLVLEGLAVISRGEGER
jgi:type III pantothenate kinase